MQFNPGEIGNIQVRKSEQKQEAGLKLEQKGDDETVTVRKITELFKRRNTGLQVGDEILKLNGKAVPSEFPDLNAMKLLIKRETVITIQFRRPYPDAESSSEEVEEEEEVEDALVVYESDSDDHEDSDSDSDSDSEQHQALVPYSEAADEPASQAVVPYNEGTKKKTKKNEPGNTVVPYNESAKKIPKKKKKDDNDNAVVPYEENTKKKIPKEEKNDQDESVVPYKEATPKKSPKKKNAKDQSVVAYNDNNNNNDNATNAGEQHQLTSTPPSIEPGQMMKLKKLKAKAEFNGSFVKVLRHAGGSLTQGRWEVEVMACPDAVFTVNANKLEMP